MNRWLRAVLMPCLAVVLGGCLAPNTMVDVSADNQTDQPVGLHLVVYLDRPEGRVDYVNATHSLAPGSSQRLASFERPCEQRWSGDLTFEVQLDNGTELQHVDFWPSDACGPQGCHLGLQADRVQFGCVFRD